jgi:hydroxymethylbilane synthase
MLPAVGQGALAIETRADDPRTLAACRTLEDRETTIAVTAERAFLARLGATCRTPVAGYAQVQGDEVVLLGRIGRTDGSSTLADQARGPVAGAADIGRALAEAMLSRGAAAMLEFHD